MARYAEQTTVSVEKSRAEIESVLTRYGARRFASGWDQANAYIQFEASDRIVRFVLPLPDRNDSAFKRTAVRKWTRSQEQALEAWEQACRQRWRALALVVKAKLEAVAAGITSFEEEFLAHIMLPNGESVATSVLPRIAEAYEGKSVGFLLPDYSKR